MWDVRKVCASMGSHRRTIMLLVASFVAACFALLGPLTAPTYAADATWTGSALTYEGHTYTPISVTGLPAADVKDKIPYGWLDTASSPQKMHVIYFAKDTTFLGDDDNPEARTSAIYIVYTYSPPSIYTGGSPPVTIDVVRDLTADANDQNQEKNNTCDGSITKGIGWIICPVSNYLADGIDKIYGFIQDFLDVRPLADDKTGTYQLWDLVRNIANVCFVIVFLVIIFSHLTSAGYSNYNLKDMLPRLIIAAIMVNASFWICAIGVDLSNSIAHSTHAILVNIRENLPTGAIISWPDFTKYALSGGAIAVIGISSTAAVSGAGLLFLLLAGLISVAFSVLVAFVILAARHALIILLVVMSPLACIAYVLPSTQSWFKKWAKAFTMLMLFAVIFAFIYGGSQLAGAAIINSADGRPHVILIGLVVQFLPLMLSLIIPRLATGILGQIANLTNDKTKGLLDKSKGWAMDNAEMHRLNKLRKAGERNSALEQRYPKKSGAKNFMKRNLRGGATSRLGLAMDQGRRKREATNKANEEYLGNREAASRQREIADQSTRYGRRMHQTAMNSHDLHKQSELYKSVVDSAGDAHWQKKFDATDSSHYDHRLHMTDIAARRNQQAAKTAEEQYNAIIDGMRTGINPYDSITGADTRLTGARASIQPDIAAMASLAVEMDAASNAKNAAAIKLKGVIAEKYKESFEGDQELLKRAAGVGGELGITRVYASAKKAATDAAVEAVTVNRSLASDLSRFDLHDVLFKGRMPDGKAASLEMKQAAMYALLQDKGNNQDAQEIRDAIGKLGMVQVEDPTTGQKGYFEVKRDSKGRIVYDANNRVQADMSRQITNSSDISLRRDWQQFFDDAKKGSAHSMVTYSGTNGSEARSGLMVEDARGAFMRDALSGKFGAEKMLKADIDELKTLYSDMVNPNGYYVETLSDDQRRVVNTALESAILELQGNENINAGIDDRNRGMMNEILARINPAYKLPSGNFPVGDDRAIIPPGSRTGGEKEFATPDAVSHVTPGYYTDRDVSFR